MTALGPRESGPLRRLWRRTRFGRILSQQPRPLKFLLSRLLMRTGLSRFMTIHRPGYRLRFYPTSISAALWIDPRDRGNEARFLQRYLRSGETMVDVGANVGTTAIPAALAVGPQGRIVAIEPHPRIASYLSANVRLNRLHQVSVIHAAVGESRGTTTLASTRADDQNRVIPHGPGIDAPLETLDALLSDTGDVTLLKIDVEGYELFVLRGASRTLQRTRCIYLECSDEHFARYGYTFADLLDFLSSRGFHIVRLGGDRARRLTRPDAARTLEDLVAVRDLADFVARTGYTLDEHPPADPR